MFENFKWFVENFGNILLIVVCFFIVLGMVVETFGRVLPTKSPDSVLTKIGLKIGNLGHGLVETGKSVKGLLDFIKFPNNLKK